MVPTCLSLNKMEVLCAVSLKVFSEESETWFHKSNLIINAEETMAMSFHTIQNRLPLRPQINFKYMDIAY